MKSTELHPTTISLAAVRWGSFDIAFEGTNTAGTWTRCTVRIDWALWPLLAGAAAIAFATEKSKRLAEIAEIEKTLPHSVELIETAKHEEERSAA